MTGSPKNIVSHALFVLKFLSLDVNRQSAADHLWQPNTQKKYAMAYWKDPLTLKWNGPDPVLIWGRGSVCVYDTREQAARWLPERLVRQSDSDQSHNAQDVAPDPTTHSN